MLQANINYSHDLASANADVMDGLMPMEKIAFVQDANGEVEEVSVPASNVSGNELMASEIARDNGKVLVELPRESASGRWRIWVKESAIAQGA